MVLVSDDAGGAELAQKIHNDFWTIMHEIQDTYEPIAVETLMLPNKNEYVQKCFIAQAPLHVEQQDLAPRSLQVPN